MCFINKKVYKFSYGNTFNFIFSEIISISINISTLLPLTILMGLLHGELEYALRENYTLLKIITILMAAIYVLYMLFLIVITFLPKKAIIKNGFIIVKRYMLNFAYFFRGFNDEIYIKDIVECKIYEGKRYLMDRSGPYAVSFFDWDDLVMIKTVNNKYYLVPLKNSTEFIEEVNKRRLALQENSVNEQV